MPSSSAPGTKRRVVVQHGRHDAGRAVGGRGDHAAAGGVLLVDRQRVQVDPVQHGQRIAQRGLGPARQLGDTAGGARRRTSSPPGRMPSRCGSRARRSPPWPRQIASRPARISSALAPGLLVGQHQLGDAEAVRAAEREQLGRRSRTVGQHGVLAAIAAGRPASRLAHDEAAADRVVVFQRAARRRPASRAREAHAVGVAGSVSR